MTDPATLDPDELFTAVLPERVRAAGAFAGVTSVGSLVFRVVDRGEWSLRLVDGALEVTRGADDDAVLQVTMPAADFDAALAEASDTAGGLGGLNVVPLVGGAPLRVLAAKPDLARMIRHVPGSVLLVATDGGVRRRALVTPGVRKANLESPECTIQCALADLRDAHAQGLPPLRLFTTGKLRITGNVQIAMALAGAFT